MDERALSELLECSVCLESLDATSKVLPCQHTFCKRCLDEIVCTKNELRCPECRTLVNIPVEELPTNILLIRLLEGMKTARAGVSGGGGGAGQGRKPGLPSPTSSKSGAGPSSSSAAAAKAASPYKTVNIAVPCAKALYSYEAKEPGDLSFKKGDTIILRKQVDENWYHGEIGNKHGFFPATYVQVITPLPQEIPTCKALYDFVITDKNEKDCLTFQKDEMVTVIRRIDNNWAEGKLGERIGIFPISFVEMNDSAKWLINAQANQARNSNNQNNSSTSNGNNGSSVLTPPVVTLSPSNAAVTTATTAASPTDAPPTPTTSGINPFLNASLLATKYLGHKRHSLTSIGQKLSLMQQQHRHSVELSGNVTAGLTTTISPVSTSSSTVTPASTQSLMSSTATPSMMTQSMIERTPDSPLNSATPTSAIYVALYNYKPVKTDEVELKKGDWYVVTEKCQDGWYKGNCLKSATSGVFPGNYVQAISRLANKTGTRTVLGTSGQQHLHQQHLAQQQQQQAGGGAAGSAAPGSSSSSGSPFSSPTTAASLLKSHHHHVSVSRAHSFPKTSPLATSSDYSAVRAGSQGVTSRAPNVTAPSHGGGGRLHTSGNGNAASQLHPTSSSSSSHKTSSGASHSSASHSTKNSSGQSAHAQEKSSASGRSSHSTHSPRNTRKTAAAERVAKHAAAISGLASSRENGATAAVPPAVSARSSSNANSSSSAQQQSSANQQPPSAHSMLTTTASVTPPNKVVGAAVDELLPSLGAISQHHPSSSSSSSHRDLDRRERDKERKEKKEKDRLSIVKRLTKSKKSKSPPPEAEASSSETKSGHHRTNSLPGGEDASSAGASASAAGSVKAPPLPHRKTASLDASASVKQPRTKPFLRERYRCIVPYPPQSDIEMELKLGDIVYVYKKREDGWYKGTLQRTGKTGLFPASFVEKF